MTTDDHSSRPAGNQGTGKNKLADRLLQLLRREREYMQLHRDSTVQSLTVEATLVGGAIKACAPLRTCHP